MNSWMPPSESDKCLRYFGSMDQLAGLRRCLLLDGKAAGVEAVEFNTGGGLEFTVLPGRGMDIVNCRYCGVPVSYLSKSGITAPGYHDGRHNEWLKSFFAGMLTTCGLSNAGPSCTDEHPYAGQILYGLHGDISNTGADQVGTWSDWTDKGYEMRVTGRVSEGRLHGEHMTLRRSVTTHLGGKSFHVRDEIRNENSIPEPLMFFYHINIGYPILDEGSYFSSTSLSVRAETEVSKANLEHYKTCTAPSDGVIEQQFFHEMGRGSDGRAAAALVNERLMCGFYLKYYPSQLPCFAQWKVGRSTDYVFAFEPGNCHPVGRNVQRRAGKLKSLEPMESYVVDMELGILDGAEEIEGFQQICLRHE